MRDAGILDGDLVVVRQQPSANDGDIVVATLDGETTLKRVRQQGEDGNEYRRDRQERED